MPGRWRLHVQGGRSPSMPVGPETVAGAEVKGHGDVYGDDGDVAAAGVGDADDGLRGVAEQLPAPLGRPVCRRPCPRIGGSSSPMTRGIAQPSDAAGDAGGFEQQVEGAVRGGGRTGSGSRCGKVGRSRSPFRSKLPESWRTWGSAWGLPAHRCHPRRSRCWGQVPFVDEQTQMTQAVGDRVRDVKAEGWVVRPQDFNV